VHKDNAGLSLAGVCVAGVRGQLKTICGLLIAIRERAREYGTDNGTTYSIALLSLLWSDFIPEGNVFLDGAGDSDGNGMEAPAEETVLLADNFRDFRGFQENNRAIVTAAPEGSAM
jgi:hypothetical protein